MKLAHQPPFKSSPSTLIIVSVDGDRCKDVVVSSIEKGPDNKKWKLYKHTQKFQDVWIAHLPWAKPVFDEKG
jgi:hypothetical protein